MNYQRIYNQIIERAKNSKRIKGCGIYYEGHHIIPKCLGGEGLVKNYNTHPNIVLLTPREHFLCHLLLCEIYPKNIKLYQALWLMSTNKNKRKNQRYKISSRVYERLKIKAREIYKNRNISNEEIEKRRKSLKKTWYKKRKKQGLIINENDINKFCILYPNINLTENNKHCINYSFNENIELENIICSCGKGIKRFQNYTQGYKKYCSRKCCNNFTSDISRQTKEDNGLWDYSKERLRRNEIKNLSKEEIEQLRRERISKGNKGKNTGGHSRGKYIIQYDLEGNFIKEWPSIRHAGLEIKGTSGETIRKCLIGLQKSAYGFKWEYKLNKN